MKFDERQLQAFKGGYGNTEILCCFNHCKAKSLGRRGYNHDDCSTVGGQRLTFNVQL